MNMKGEDKAMTSISNHQEQSRAEEERNTADGSTDENEHSDKSGNENERSNKNENEHTNKNENKKTNEEKPNERWRPLLLLGAVIAALVLARILGLGEGIGGLRDWIDSLGPWGPVVFVIIYIAAVVVAFPASLLTVAAGVLFGAVLGVILVSVAATTGASLAFLIGRYFARDATERWLAGNMMFRRLEMMTEDHGPMMVALVRLVPLFPFNLVNYGFCLTKIPFRTYVFWSWLCMLPFTIVFVLGADILVSFSEGKIPWVLMGVLVMVGIILGVVVKHAHEIIYQKEKECLDKRGASCVEDIYRE